jgi:hypothetical protein
MLESTDPKFEFINYDGNTSIFALQAFRRHAIWKRQLVRGIPEALFGTL